MCVCVHVFVRSSYNVVHSQVDLPQDTVIFDASQTQDDMGLDNLKFHWQLEAGPMGMTGESDKALLTLTNPQPGKYRYK